MDISTLQNRSIESNLQIDRDFDSTISGMKEKGKALIHQILAGRKEMHDYTSGSLRFGGFYYKRICEVFGITNITVNFYEEEKLKIESPKKIILYENGSVYIFLKIKDDSSL